jgi:hypothetical protein
LQLSRILIIRKSRQPIGSSTMSRRLDETCSLQADFQDRRKSHSLRLAENCEAEGVWECVFALYGLQETKRAEFFSARILSRPSCCSGISWPPIMRSREGSRIRVIEGWLQSPLGFDKVERPKHLPQSARSRRSAVGLRSDRCRRQRTLTPPRGEARELGSESVGRLSTCVTTV